MKKSVLIAIIIIAIIVVLGIIFIPSLLKDNKEPGKETPAVSTSLEPVKSAEDLTKLVDKIYEGQNNLLPSLATQEIDITDADMVQYVTGLKSASDIEFAVVSEPMMSSQAYSLILVKVKDGVNASEIAKQMKDGVDTRKWICVTAEKVYATNSGNVVCLVMSSEEMAKPIYEKFKSLAGTVGEEFVRTEEAPEMPDDMLRIPAEDGEMLTIN